MAQWWSFSALQFEKMFEQGHDLECMDTNALCVFVSLQRYLRRFVLFLLKEMKASQRKSSILSWLLFFRTVSTFSLGMKQSQRSLLPLRSKISSLELETLRSKKLLTEQCRYLHTGSNNQHSPTCAGGWGQWTLNCSQADLPDWLDYLSLFGISCTLCGWGWSYTGPAQCTSSHRRCGWWWASAPRANTTCRQPERGGEKSVVMHHFCMGCDWLKFK